MAFDLTPIAQAHGIAPDTLAKVMANAGWDFSPLANLHGEEAARVLAFATQIATDKAKTLADIQARRLARAAKEATAEQARLTPAAKAQPSRVCGKCSGAGKLGWANHVEKGRCFWCGGTGVIRAKGAK